MTTISDVARLAQVSTATVSRVINNTGPVKDTTRERVYKVIRQLNYSPNQVARSLYQKRSKIIGIIIPDIRNQFYAMVIEGIKSVLQPLDFASLIAFDPGKSSQTYSEYIEKFESNNVAGIITAAFDLTHPEDIQTPLIMFDSADIKDSIPRIVSDNISGGKYCVDLLGKKTKYVIIECYSIVYPTIQERLNSIIATLNQRNIQYSIEMINSGEEQIRDPDILEQKILRKYPNADALIAPNDIYAVAAISEAKKLGKSIPHDFQVVGYDNTNIGYYISPALSTVDQQPILIGQTAAKRLVQILEGKGDSYNSVIPVKKIQRSSTQ